MNADIARPDLASCRTRLVRAKLVGRVHWLCCAFHHSQHANGRLLFQALMTFSPVSGELPSCCNSDAYTFNDKKSLKTSND